MFWERDEIKPFVLPDSIQDIPELSFGSMDSLEEMVIPDNVAHPPGEGYINTTHVEYEEEET